MNKINIGTNIFDFPMPVTLLGAMVNGKPNFMALGWISRANANPPMVIIGVGNHHYTARGLKESGTFSINYPTAEMLAVTDYCGIATGEKTDKSGLFDIFYGELETAPMISECTLSLECRIVREIELNTNTLYLGEIIASYSEEKFMTGGKPDIKKMNPLLLTMPDNRYWTVGDHAGNAWKDGRDYGKRK